jgi:SAM-dependent methyltransferase
MPEPLPFEPRRFQSAAAHYLAGRTPYPNQLIERVAQLVDMGPGDRVLDLGCGPGQLGRAFAPRVAEVVGIDPEPEMLRIASEMSSGLGNISWRQGSSYDLSPATGSFKLVCIGRAFHWMDRVDVLRRLEGIVTADGAIALFSDTQLRVPDNGWRQGYRDVLDRYADGESARRTWRSPEWVRHEAILLESSFRTLEQIRVIYRHEVDVETLIQRALSMSSTSVGRLRGRAEEMVADLRTVLPQNGMIREVIASSALLAWRPG